jgi:hypothetical protein
MKYGKSLMNTTPAELAESVVFPAMLIADQQKEASEQLARFREKVKEEMTVDTWLALNDLQLQFQKEDPGGSGKNRI